MNQTAKKIFILILILAAPALTVNVLAQSCETRRWSFTENFDTTDYKDLAEGINSVAQWPAGPIELNRLGASFSMDDTGKLGGHIYVCDSGDFNGDGYPDLIGQDIWRQKKGYTNPQSCLVFIKNNSAGQPKASFAIDPPDAQHASGFDTFNTHTGPAAITVGDYNGDGLLDFFFMRDSTDDFHYDNFQAVMYINVGTSTAPNFRPYNQSPTLDFTAKFKDAGIYVNWAGNHLCSVDIDKDGDIDILAISQDKIFLVRNPGAAGAGDIYNWTAAELSYDYRTDYVQPLVGGTCISAADFDLDGDIEIVCGTVDSEYDYLFYYDNDGSGHFIRMDISIPPAYVATCVSPVGLATKDFDNDGRPDIFGAGDSAHTGPPAHVWILTNKGATDTPVTMPDGSTETVKVIQWQFKCLNSCDPVGGGDLDFTTPIDYDKDGDYDIIVADANDSGDYYLLINGLAKVFALFGQAQSTNIAAGLLDEHEHAATRIRLVNLTQTYRGTGSPVYDGLKVQLYFSNDGGTNWELYSPPDVPAQGTWTGSQIANVNNGTDVGWYDFKHLGADVRWRLILTAPYDPMTDFPDNNASLDTPSIDQIRVELEYVFRQEYSRSSAAATITTLSGTTKKLVIGSSFIYPGWEGQLRAYDVTPMTLTGGQYSALNTVTVSDLGSPSGRRQPTGAVILWDAGLLLQDRNADLRTIYTAIRPNKGATTVPLQRLEFTRANAATLGQFLGDVQNDNAGLIDFVRGKNPDGSERDWKLGDINHSSPVVVGPPDGDPALMGTGYESFKTDYASRSKVLYLGANDGMLHCFNAVTGEELWGFIPYNLLPKLTNQWKPAANTSRYYFHDVFVDGSPAVADVQIDGQWRTVLICGQGPGKGSIIDQGYNYYFALDITDPTNPIPLWEITHSVITGSGRNRVTNYTMGETWSVPAIGKINDGGTERWVAFMGSGYNNVSQSTAGRYFYVVRIDKTGVADEKNLIIRNVSVANVNTTANGTMSGWKGSYKYTDIPAALVASPTAVDSDNDGKINFVYVGDLDGRLYRMDVTGTASTSWNLTAIYTDALYYPIITKPAVWVDPLPETKTPRIYFGTGGDDAAPIDRQYSFVGIMDSGAGNATVEWYIGDSVVLGGLDASKKVGDTGGLGAGFKVWADPVVSDYTVYFSTLPGSIEAVNPCVNLQGAGRLYARILRASTTGLPVGGTALKTAAVNPPEYLDLVSKARRAVTVGDVVETGGVKKREIFIQEYNSTIEMLEQAVESTKLQIKSWREVYKII